MDTDRGPGNRLLLSISDADAALLAPHLEPLEMKVQTVMERPGAVIEHVYFLDAGIGSTVAVAGRDKRVEVGLFGWDGMSAHAVLLGSERAHYECFMQVGGSGRRIAVAAMRDALDRSLTLRLSLLRYVQAYMMQLVYTALSNAQSSLEERLCRWLLMCRDRSNDAEIALTHEFLSTMLGVRRAGVTNALHVLEGEHLIRARRGRITITDREGLQRRAGACYGPPEAAYEDLLGVSLRALSA